MASGPRACVGRFVHAFSVRNRRRKAGLIQAVIDEQRASTALLVGVEAAAFPWSNIVERAVVDKLPSTIASGLGPRIGMGTRELLCDGRRLPFRDDSFDLVVSNAVIEHVGDESDQVAFVAEHHRCGRAFVITTPNLLFPVESHTQAVFLHWSRVWRARHPVEFSRLLTRRSFRRLLPADGTRIIGRIWSPAFVAVHVCSSDCETGPRTDG
ncbi:MAG TPA: methyltransferase domain-containing protein [Mycobacteriales bacterium]|nr:methyltransferase domain-containing protein [Mycobacteriales bacterium]